MRIFKGIHIPLMRLLPALAVLLLLSGCSRHKSDHYLYSSNCGICHHGGQGMAGSVPPLIGRVDRIAAMPDGRRYLASVLINGLSGPITASGQKYSAEMPPFRYLSDDQIARILSWLSAQGSTRPAPVISAQDVADARAHRIGASGTTTLRAEMNHTHPFP